MNWVVNFNPYAPSESNTVDIFGLPVERSAEVAYDCRQSSVVIKRRGAA